MNKNSTSSVTNAESEKTRVRSPRDYVPPSVEALGSLAELTAGVPQVAVSEGLGSYHPPTS